MSILSILVWQEAGKAVLMAIGVIAMCFFARWLVQRKKENKPTLLDPDLFSSNYFRLAYPSRCCKTSPWAA